MDKIKVAGEDLPGRTEMEASLESGSLPESPRTHEPRPPRIRDLVGAHSHRGLVGLMARETNDSVLRKTKMPANIIRDEDKEPRYRRQSLHLLHRESGHHHRHHHHHHKETAPGVPYVELDEWWKKQRSTLSKDEKDIPPIGYEDKSLFDLISSAAAQPRRSEGRQWEQILADYKEGLRNENQSGYQYKLGSFPIMFK